MIRLTTSILALWVLAGCTEAVAPETNSSDRAGADSAKQTKERQSMPIPEPNIPLGGGSSDSQDN